MRRWSLLLLLAAVWAADEEELLSKRVYLKTPASFVNLTSESWKITEDTKEVLVAVRFLVQSPVGRILSTKCIRQDGNLEAELIISLENAQLQVDLVDAMGSSLLIKPLINDYMNESAEHSVAVRINAVTKSLSYSVEQRTERTAEITGDIQWAGAEILATIGGGQQAVIGCIALVAIQVNDREPFTRAVVISENEVDKCQTETECSQRNCGQGRCLALEVATCDCYGTGKAGPSCANEPKTVELNNNDDTDSQQAAVYFTPWSEDQDIKKIVVEFRFKGTYEGVIVYGGLEGGGYLKMYVVDRKGTLVISDMKMNFTLGSNNDFHYVRILLGEQLHLTVDGVIQNLALPAPLKFKSLIFGSSPPNDDGVTELGLTACVRNIYVDHLDLLELQSNKDSRVATPKALKSCSDGSEVLKGVPTFPTDVEYPDFPNEDSLSDPEDDTARVPLPQDPQISKSGFFGVAKKNPSMPCEKAQEYLCRNGATCNRGSTRPSCLCAPGYAGSFCQFSLFPRSCAEALKFHRLPEGPTRLDVDASGDLSTSVAECKDETTKVPHDMPPNTMIRAAEAPKHGLFVLSYRDFSHDKLQALIAHSGLCRQQVNYKCNHAPLHFSDKRTWFRVASKNATLRQMGAVPNGCLCIDIGCADQGRCNCDAGIIGTDEGVLQGQQAGITSIVALHRGGDVSGEMTVSQLECVGFASENNAIRFQKPGSYLLEEWNGGALSLHFRTADAVAILFSINKAEKRVLQLELMDGHTLKAATGEGDIVVESQAKLNDTRWHLVTLEWDSEELRVSVDAATSFRALNANPFGNVTLGDLDNGIVGCFRSILLGNKAVDLKGSIDGITFGRCEDSCGTTSCHNGAECRENFATGVAQCSCKYPRLHSGADCSHDINSDSSVSFHGGFLRFDDLTSPLIAPWLLSFRTDQSSALLLYVHDENHNFLQLHLHDEVNVTLSLNNGGVVYICTVQAPPATEYSDMRWIQVYIDHGPTGSTLTVEDEACSIRTGRLLATEPMKDFKVSAQGSDIVRPPVGVEDAHKKFTYSFVGGVERPEQSNEFHLKATYTSKVEDLLGCVRGVKVGDTIINLRKKSKEAKDKALVQVGCDLKCETLSCHNGGHCSVAWKDFTPESVKATCDCSRTSYAGPHCRQDEGISFVPPQSVSFDVGAILQGYLEQSSPPAQTLKFAFSANPIGFRQMLAILYFNDSSEFEILLNKNGSLHVGIAYADGRSTAVMVKGNFTDGYRHFFVARFIGSGPTRIFVDGVRVDISHRGHDNMTLFQAKKLWLGGQRAPPGFEHGQVEKKNLQGCVSNVNLNLGAKVLDLWPFSYLDTEHKFSVHTILQPQTKVEKRSCAAFRNPNQAVSPGNSVSLPVWDTNFARQEYKVQPGDLPEEEGGGTPWLLIILAIILVLILIGLIVVVCCLCRKGHKESQPQNISLDEREPLRQTQYPPTPPVGSHQPHSNYSVPPPDIQLPTTRAEDFSDGEELDRTLTPGSEAPTVFEDEISRPTGFDRSSPQRLSSFRDSSAPIGSPLYAPENGRRLKPVNIPRPPPRMSPA